MVALRDRLHIEFPLEFAIQCEFADMNIGVEHRSLRRAGGFEAEVGASFDQETTAVELMQLGEIEITSVDIEVEDTGCGVEGSISGDDGIIVKKMGVLERKFAVGEVQGGIELLHGLAVNGGVGEMDPTLAVRVGPGACCLEKEIGGAG